jgi:hypothetical protein
MKKITILALAIILLAGCSTFRDIERAGAPPALPMPQQMTAAQKASPSGDTTRVIVTPDDVYDIAVANAGAGSVEVQDEAFTAGNFNADATHAVSQDDFYDRMHLFDTDDDGSFADEAWLTAYLTPAELTTALGAAYDTEAELDALFAAKQDASTAATDAEIAALEIDDIQTALGISTGATHLGEFTGSTITDNQTVKAAIQELETAIEAGGADAFTVKVDAGATAGYLGAANSDGVLRTDGTIVTYADGGDYVTIGVHAYLVDIAGITAAQGDIIYFDGTDWVNLGPGLAGQYLKTGGAAANPSWDDPAGSGDITAVGDAASGSAFTADGGGNSLYFEGTTANAFEIQLTGANPDADYVVTIPAATGTILLTDGVGTALTALNGENIQDDTIDDDSIDWSDVTAADITMTDATIITASGLITANAGLTIATGQALTVGVVQWDNGSDYIDGENIADDTIDDDSIDFADVTLNDLTFDVGSVSKTEFGYLDGVTSAIQTQIDGKEATDAEIARFDTADTVGADWEWQDGIAMSFGNDNDWELAYDETTDDRLEYTHTAGAGADVYWDLNDNAANSVFTVTNSDGTYDAVLTADQLSVGGGGMTVDGDGDTVVKTLQISGASGTTGAVRIYEDPAYQTEYRGWLAQDNFTASLDFRFPNAVPTAANQFMVFGVPSSDISDITFAGLDTTYFDVTSITSIDTQFKGVAAGTVHTSLAASQVMVDTDGITDLAHDLLVYSDGTTDYIVLSLAEADIPSTGEDDYVVSYDADANKFYMAAGGGGGSVAWDDITNPDANDEIDFGAYVTELNVDDLRIGDGGSNYAKFSGSALTFAGTYSITLPADSVDSSQYVDASIDDAHLNKGSGAGQIDYSDFTTGNISTSGTAATGVLTVTGVINTSVGLDGVGAVDMDYGSADITDHTFVSDGGTFVVDGGFTAGANSDMADYDITSVDKLEGVDSAVFIDIGADGIVQVAADTAIHLDLSDETITLADGGANQIDISTDTGVDTIYASGISIAARALTPTVADPDTWTMSGKNMYGGTWIANAAGTGGLPAVTAGMHFTVIVEGANTVIIDPNAADTIYLDGAAETQDENITTDGTSGAVIACQYRSANAWSCTGDGLWDGATD